MRTLNIFFLALCAVILVSCEKFLEKPPEGRVPEDEALVDEASLQNLINGTFNTQAHEIYNGRIWFINDLMSDEVNGVLYTEDNGEIYNRKTSIFGAYKNDAYRKLYHNVYRANKVLEKISLASTNRNKIEGEAKFIRAMMHFEAVRMWAQPWGFTADNSHAGVPIRTAASIDPLDRSSVKQVYDFIIADLKSAENLLSDVPVLGYPSKWAAKALLAKVYFQQNDFTNAFAYADQVIKSNKFSLDNAHAKRFSLVTSNEIVFGFKHVTGVTDEMVNELKGRYRSDVDFNAGDNFKVTDQFRNLATQAGDVRASWYTTVSGYNAITKYNADHFNIAVIHLTEIKLIRAESAAETGGANVAVGISDINDILARAYGGTTMNLPTTAIAADVIRVTRIQRELEMVGEGNRTNEIKRLSARTNATPDRRNAPKFCPGLTLQFPQGERSGKTDFLMNPEGGCN